MPENEHQLLLLLTQSDSDAFRTLFDHYQPLLFRHACYRCRDYALSQDVVQESFLRVWQQRAKLNPAKSFYALLIKICDNLLLDHARHQTVRQANERQIPAISESLGDHPERWLDYQQLAEAINRVVNNDLPPKCRAIFILSRVNNHSTKEIAAMLKISTKTVENQLTKALSILRKKLAAWLS